MGQAARLRAACENAALAGGGDPQKSGRTSTPKTALYPTVRKCRPAIDYPMRSIYASLERLSVADGVMRPADYALRGRSEIGRRAPVGALPTLLARWPHSGPIEGAGCRAVDTRI